MDQNLTIKDAFTDVLFYQDRVSRSTILTGFTNVLNIPNKKEWIILNEKNYEVKYRIFDFDKKVIHIALTEEV